MPKVKVYGSRPDSGPGRMTADAALHDLNHDHATWLVTMAWNASDTTYTSAVAGEQALEDAVKAKLPGYHYLATPNQHTKTTHKS